MALKYGQTQEIFQLGDFFTRLHVGQYERHSGYISRDKCSFLSLRETCSRPVMLLPYLGSHPAVLWGVLWGKEQKQVKYAEAAPTFLFWAPHSETTVNQPSQYLINRDRNGFSFVSQPLKQVLPKHQNSSTWALQQQRQRTCRLHS